MTEEEKMRDGVAAAVYVHPVLKQAIELMNKKALDYNGRVDADPARHGYFPFGHKSYLQMLHTKMNRIMAVAEKEGKINFESLGDSLLDIINYAAFYKAWVDSREIMNHLLDEEEQP